MDAWVAPVLALVGVMVGALLQWFLTRSAETQKRRQEIRAKAYADYLRSMAALTYKGTDTEDEQAYADVLDAHCRLLVYGSHPVVSAVLNFTKAHSDDFRLDAGDFGSVINAIRAESQPEGRELGSEAAEWLTSAPRSDVDEPTTPETNGGAAST
jgi:hypothetical protein